MMKPSEFRLRTTPVNFSCPMPMLDVLETWAHARHLNRSAAIRLLLGAGLNLSPDGSPLLSSGNHKTDPDQLPDQTAIGGGS